MICISTPEIRSIPAGWYHEFGLTAWRLAGGASSHTHTHKVKGPAENWTLEISRENRK